MSVSQPSHLGALVPNAPNGERAAGLGATVRSLAERTVRRYMRTPELVLYAFMGSAVFMLLFRYIIGGSIHMGHVRYVDYLVPGFVMTSVLVTGTGVATAVAEDIDQGVFDRFRSLPVPRFGLALGRVVGDTVIIAATLAATAALGFLLGFPPAGHHRPGPVGLCAVRCVRVRVSLGIRLHRAIRGKRARRPGPVVHRLPADVLLKRIRTSPDASRLGTTRRRAPACHGHGQRRAIARVRQPRSGRTRAHLQLLDFVGAGLGGRHHCRVRPARCTTLSAS